MTFLIITHASHKESEGHYFSYGPFIREMNLWIKYADEVIIVAPLIAGSTIQKNEIPYVHERIRFISIPQFDFLTIRALIKSFLILPLAVQKILKGIRMADHIHLRCPGNIGLLGCVLQIFFPGKKKTAKYAGNWDWKSKQPWSYRLQQRILRNTFLTRNMTVLVYGEWPDKTKNIKPFFTASYSEKDRMPVNKNNFSEGVKLAFVGGLFRYKNPDACLDVLKALTDKNIKADLTYCGDGIERDRLEQRVKDLGLTERVTFLGNVNSEKVKEVLKNSHFLVFISSSEGWPKAVAESMWWGCLPITTAVSCIPQMLDDGNRGDLVDNNVKQIVKIIERYLESPAIYAKKVESAVEWSRQYTLERFESEIKYLI